MADLLSKYYLRALELDVTYKCNMGCMQCNRALGVCPSQEMMTIEQIQKVLSESLSMAKPYQEIRVLGGEPTLHPQISKIVIALDWYRSQVVESSISIWTNGHGERVKQELKNLPAWMRIRVSHKKLKVGGDEFEPFLAAPIDYSGICLKDYNKGCSQIAIGKCGVGVSLYGIYVCPVAAAIDRVVGLDIGIRNLTEISSERLREQCGQLCRYCGHFLKDNGLILPIKTVSDTWRMLIKRYKKRRSELTLY